jgi:hypothetical protein
VCASRHTLFLHIARRTPFQEITVQAEQQIDLQIRLATCHLAILRYRWEHGQLPPSLSDLELDFPIADPATGWALAYQVTGTRYQLTSTEAISDRREGAGRGHALFQAA